MKKNLKSALIAAVLVASFGLAMAGGTYAYFTDTGAHETLAQVESVAGSISEPTMEEIGDKNAVIVNTGNVPCYVRVQVTVNFPEKYKGITFESGDDWLQGSDGNYYYSKALAAGESTSTIFKQDTLDFATSKSYDGLSITFKQECVTTTLYGEGDQTLTDSWEIWSYLDGASVTAAKPQPGTVALTPSITE